MYTFTLVIQNKNRESSKNLAQNFKLIVLSIAEYIVALACNFSY